MGRGHHVALGRAEHSPSLVLSRLDELLLAQEVDVDLQIGPALSGQRPRGVRVPLARLTLRALDIAGDHSTGSRRRTPLASGCSGGRRRLRRFTPAVRANFAQDSDPSRFPQQDRGFHGSPDCGLRLAARLLCSFFRGVPASLSPRPPSFNLDAPAPASRANSGATSAQAPLAVQPTHSWRQQPP